MHKLLGIDSKDKNVYKQEVLGRTNHLLSFDTTKTTYKMKNLAGEAQTPR
jgi:hypothetical protein